MSRVSLESLEPRRLFAATAVLKSGTLTIKGTSGVDTFNIASNGSQVQILVTTASTGATIQKTFNSVKAVRIYGQAGNDSVMCIGVTNKKIKLSVDGGAGDDTIVGSQNGNDVLTGGAGKDTLTGGLGKDTFNTKGDGSADLITGHAGAIVNKDKNDVAHLS